MSAGKFVELQHQMRQNQEELSDYLKSLESWEGEIKQTDEKLKDTTVNDNSESKLPPVRNSLEKKQRKKKKKAKRPDEQIDCESKPNRLKGYDYRAWDKFDVEKACEEVEKEASGSDSEYETDEEWEVLRKKQQANLSKDQGNQYFKEGKYMEAVECYTRGIECDPMNGVLPANRAMALIKQEKFAAAESDCTAAISIDPTYIKAYHRRATARLGLKKFKEAQSDFERILKLEPHSKIAKKELERIDKILHPPPFSQTTAGEAGIVKAVYKPPEKRSKKPLRRLEIEEVGDDEEEEKRKKLAQNTQSAQGRAKREMEARDYDMFEKKFASNSPDNPLEGTEPQGRTEDESSASAHPEQVVSSPADILSMSQRRNSGDSATVKDDLDSPEAENKDSAEGKALHIDLVDVSEGRTNTDVVPGDSPRCSPRVPPPPSTSYQFQADWKVLKDTTEHFYQYLKAIDPRVYPKLFGQALDADILVKIFNTLKNFYIPNELDPCPVLRALPQVKRFSMTVMFMSSKEKQVAKDLFDHMSSVNAMETSDLEKLKRKYDL